MGGFDSALANLTMMSARPSPSTSPAGDRAVMPDPPGAAISVRRLPKPATLTRLGGAACANDARSGSTRSAIQRLDAERLVRRAWRAIESRVASRTSFALLLTASTCLIAPFAREVANRSWPCVFQREFEQRRAQPIL